MTVNIDILKIKLCQAIDGEGNVLNSSVVLDIITELYSTDITTEELERTRLGKYVNLIRKKTSDQYISSQARALVKKWKKLVISTKPDIANGFLKRKKGQSSRESTPVNRMCYRSDTPIDDSSRDSTASPITNGFHHPSQDAAPHLYVNESGVKYESVHYTWSDSIPIRNNNNSTAVSQPPPSSDATPTDIPSYVIMPYVVLD